MHNYPWNDFQAATTLKLTAHTTAQTLTNLTTVYKAAVQAYIQVQTAPVRYGMGGYTPAATTGYFVDQNQTVTLQGWDEMRNFLYIRGGATNAVLWCTYKFPKGSHSRK